MEYWSLQDAKSRFSELVNICLREGPQTVTRHGEPAVVLMAVDEYKMAVAPRQSFKDFLLAAPRADLNISRPKDVGREVDL